MSKPLRIAVFGAAHLDTLATVTGFAETVDRPGRVIQGFGGTGYNLATALAAHGLSVRFALDLKAGLFERLLARDLRRRGIETDIRYHADFPTAGFCAHIVNGDLQAAVSATPIEAVTLAEPRIRAILADTQAVVADCNHSVGTLKAIQAVAQKLGQPLFLAGVSESKALKIADLAPNMAGVFVNRREAYYLLRQRCPDLSDYRDLARRMQTTLIVTRDADGAAIVTATDTRVMPSPFTQPARHYLGTGDALMAAALHARLVRELGWPAALHAALTAIAATARGDTCNTSMGADVEAGLEQLGRYGQVDAATGLPNRIALREAIELGVQECSWGHPPFTVWFADVDGFKAINDTYGHIAGDQVLTALGSAMRHVLPARSVVARFGGDEFAGLTPASPEAVAQWLGQIRAVRAGGQRIAVSLSVGAIAYTGGMATADSLIAEADQRMLVGRRGIVRDRHTLVAKQQEAH